MTEQEKKKLAQVEKNYDEAIQALGYVKKRISDHLPKKASLWISEDEKVPFIFSIAGSTISVYLRVDAAGWDIVFEKEGTKSVIPDKRFTTVDGKAVTDADLMDIIIDLLKRQEIEEKHETIED